jgi:hypothetical protein
VSATHQWVGDDSPAITTATNQFVAQNQRRTAQSAVPQKSRNIRATNPSDLDRNFRFTTLGLRPRPLFHLNPAGSGIDQSLHRPKYKTGFVSPNIALVIFLTE